MEPLHLIPKSHWEAVQKDLTEIKKLLSQKQADQFKFTWVESQKVPGILGISNRTWQTYRDRRLISFSQFGSKIYVKLSDLDSFLEKHRISNSKK